MPGLRITFPARTHQVGVPLSDKEAAVLAQFANQQQRSQAGVMRSALMFYQLIMDHDTVRAAFQRAVREMNGGKLCEPNEEIGR